MSKPTSHPLEFEPGQMESALAAFDRRTFLKLMGASLAAAGAGGLGACSSPQPAERIVPYVRSPENVIPGLPAFYASALPSSGFASGFGRGVIVESHEGRPTKIEGNPLHPSSLGATDTFMQASVLQLYDPGRSKMPLQYGRTATWGGLLDHLGEFIDQHGGPENLRIRLLTRTLTSPALAAQLQTLQILFPKLIWHIDDIPGQSNARAGQQLALGRSVTVNYDFTKARRIVSLDAHFLCAAEDPGALRYAREFSQLRRLPLHDFGPNQPLHPAGPATMPAIDAFSRLYMAESTLSFTGARADHRLPVQPSMIPRIAAAFAEALLNLPASTAPASTALPSEITRWVNAAAADLAAHPRESLVLAGEYLDPQVHALVHAINAALQADGNTLRYLDPVDIIPGGPTAEHSLAALTTAMKTGEVDLLLLADVNPAFTAPADLAFSQELSRFTSDQQKRAVHLGGYVDETAIQCTHHVPLSHPLESWGDLRGHDGIASIVQPLIEPLWQSVSMIEFFAALISLGAERSTKSPSASAPSASAADRYATGYELVRRHWLDQWKSPAPADQELRWRKSLRDGIIEQSPAASIQITPASPATLLANLTATLGDAPTKSSAIELTIRPDPSIGDGESGWANHPWLQELPKPITHVTWENIALVGPATAKSLGIGDDLHESRETVPVLRITAGDQTVEVPAWIQIAHPENTITLHLGGGHTIGGDVQKNVGTNIYPLRTTAQPWHRTGGDIRAQNTGRRMEIAFTQSAEFMSDREAALSRNLADLPPQGSAPPNPDIPGAPLAGKSKTVPLSLYDRYPYAGYKWGMVIDLSACIGCNACVIACQSENNSPTVGKDQVRRGRAMHWIRIDTYYGATSAHSAADVSANPEIHLQPMLCQHCENAPCEVVCPTEATSHSEEGINEMTYNRCVGTRYCSNNCPYKVRRFNFYNFSRNASYGISDNDFALAAMQKNPNVTVRSRGVMEKCTYCIQRINRARIAAKRDWARSQTPINLTTAPPMRESAPDADLPTGEQVIDLPRLQIQSACQQACPTEAIIFGDLNDASAMVRQLKAEKPWSLVSYGVLTELNTRPRTSYLERLKNPNPALSNTAAASAIERSRSSARGGAA